MRIPWPTLLLMILVHGVARAEDGIETAGSLLQLALPAASVAATWMHDDRPGFEQFAKSAALTVGVTYALKLVIDEKRPNGGLHSFPSGHSSTSFNSAEFLRKRYGWAWGAPAYAVACFVGYSRVESKQHHCGDVLAGALIGVASSDLFARSFGGASFELSSGGGAYGFELVFPW